MAAKNKNQNQIRLFMAMFIIEFCLTFVTLCLVSIIFYSGLHKTTVNCSNAANNQQRLAIAVNDNGFVPSGFALRSGQPASLTIRNTGKMPHSFVSDKLNINSGPILAGQIKTIEIPRLPDEIAEYDFYSNASGDDQQIFSGIIMTFQ